MVNSSQVTRLKLPASNAPIETDSASDFILKTFFTRVPPLIDDYVDWICEQTLPALQMDERIFPGTKDELSNSFILCSGVSNLGSREMSISKAAILVLSGLTEHPLARLNSIFSAYADMLDSVRPHAGSESLMTADEFYNRYFPLCETLEETTTADILGEYSINE